jgi:hypothetical protein
MEISMILECLPKLYIPIPLSLEMLLAILDFSSLAESGVIVEEEGDRENVLARGPRCVSFNSEHRR